MTVIIKRPYTPAFSRAVGHPVSVAQLRKIVGCDGQQLTGLDQKQEAYI